MTHVQPYIRSGVLAELKQYLTVRGAHYDALARDAGLAACNGDAPQQQQPLNATMAMFDLAVSRAGPPRCFVHGQRPDRRRLEREKKSRRTMMSSTQLVAAMNRMG